MATVTGSQERPSPRSTLETAWSEYIRRAAAGEHQALARLYDESSPLLYSVAIRILGNPADAEEVTLDVYSQVWREAGHYDASRGGPSAWLVMLARSRSLDRLRRRGSRSKHETPLEGLPEPQSTLDPPEEMAASAERRRLVTAAMQELAPEQREVIELSFYLGYTHSELAETLGQPLGTVKTRIRLGMTKLRQALRPGGQP